MREKIVSFFTVFTSTGTLLCCALPATLAAIAGGTAVTSLISTMPWLIPLSQNKEWIFLIAGILLIISAVFTFRPQSKLACAITGGDGCEVAGNFSKIMLYISITIYFIGLFFAYFLTPILRWMDSL
jgi:mercuric ion transport protein